MLLLLPLLLLLMLLTVCLYTDNTGAVLGLLGAVIGRFFAHLHKNLGRLVRAIGQYSVQSQA
jgi:uncharacterized membrane protein YdjX (TVP38/TMEM64 family)